MRLALPQQWLCHGKLLLGLGVDKDQRYCLFAMDLTQIYIESLDRNAIVDRALSYGVAGARRQLRELTMELCTAINDTSAVSIKTKHDKILITVSEPIEWTFVAVRQPPETAALFFLALSILQARKILDFKLRLDLYERHIERKDRYVDFLQENVRALQMGDLLQRYKHTPAPFESAEFEASARSEASAIEPVDDWLAVRQASLFWTGGTVDLLVFNQSENKAKFKLETPSLPPDLEKHSKDQVTSSIALNSQAFQQNSQRKRRRLGGMSIGNRRSSSPIKASTRVTKDDLKGDRGNIEDDAAGGGIKLLSVNSLSIPSSPVRTQRDSED